MTSSQYFGNILVKILPNDNKMDILRIYTERAIEKCQRWDFQTSWKPRTSKSKSVDSFAGYPVTSSPAVDQSEFSSYLVHFNEGGGAAGSDIGNQENTQQAVGMN